MIPIDKEQNKEIIEESIQYLQTKGFENIKADVDGFDTPKSYRKQSDDVVITPDIVAERAGVKHYFEVGIKSEKPSLLKSKWRFLEVLSRMKQHRFKVISKRGHYKFTNQMLDELNLNKALIKL